MKSRDVSEIQKEAGLRNPWNSVMWRKSKIGVFAQSVSFRNFFESLKRVTLRKENKYRYEIRKVS